MGRRRENNTPSKENPVGKGLGVGVNAAGFRSCTNLSGGVDEEVDRNLLSKALEGMLCGFD